MHDDIYVNQHHKGPQDFECLQQENVTATSQAVIGVIFLIAFLFFSFFPKKLYIYIVVLVLFYKFKFSNSQSENL